MTTIAESKTWTEEALLASPRNGYKFELVGGELHTMPPAGPDHCVVCANIIGLLRDFCRPRQMGIVLDGQAGFYMADGDLYSPDVSVLSVARWKKLSPKKRRKFIRGSPDLAVEVLSSSEPRRHEEMKIAGYLENDTAIAWLVDIVHQTVTVYTPTGKPRVRSVKDTLTADPIFPGLSIPVPAIFEDVDAG